MKRVSMFATLLTPLVLAACYGTGFDPKDSDTAVPDNDGDSYDALVDCNDDDAAINPGATEICDDGVDNNCDQLTDAEDTTTCPAGTQ